jgi:hypothetical protein
MRTLAIRLVAASLLAASALVASAEDAGKSALERAKAGQWVSYKMKNDMAMKQSVAKVEGKKVTIKNEMWIKGQPLPSNETPIDLDRKNDASEKAAKTDTTKAEEGELEINGHKLKCRILTQGTVKTWVCDDVPITGIVRQELNGQPTMELTGYGNTLDEDRLKKS